MSGLFAIPFFKKNPSLKPHSFCIYKALHLFFTRLIQRTAICIYNIFFEYILFNGS